MKHFNGKGWIAAGLAGMMAAAMSITAFAENGWTRVSPRSAWDGTYYRSDGQRVTVTDTDQEYALCGRIRILQQILSWCLQEKSRRILLGKAEGRKLYLS